MGNIFDVSFSLIKEKKIQNFLVGIIICLCVALCSASIGTLLNLDDLYIKSCNKQKVSHTILEVNKKQYNYKQLQKWFNSNQYVESTSSLAFYEIKSDIYNNTRKIEALANLVEYPAESINQDLLVIVEGEQKSNPEMGEVWVPTGFAYANDIRVGDELTFRAGDRPVTLKVSAIVVHPYFSTHYINPTRIWIGQGEISSIVPFSQCDDMLLSVRYSDYLRKDNVWKEFEDYLSDSFGGGKQDFDTYSNTSTVTSKLVTQVMLGFAILITIIMILIISFMISNSMLSEYKTIGVYKSQGFSNGDIIWIYILHYMCLGFIAVPIGLIMSKGITNLIMANFVKAMGLIDADLRMGLPMILTSVIILSAIFVVVLITSRKVRKIKPIDAIRFGGVSKKDISKKIFAAKYLLRLPINLFISTKEILYDMKKTIFLCVMIVSMTCMFFSANSVVTSIKMTVKDPSAIGLDNSEIWIINSETEYSISNDYLLKKILKNKDVKNAMPMRHMDMSSLKINNKSQPIMGIAFQGDMDQMGLVNIEGRHPKTYNEISIAKVTSEETEKIIGDMIDIYIEGKKSTFLITGIYQTVSNFGRGYRIQFSAVEKISPNLEANFFAVDLKEGVDVDQVKLTLKKEVGELTQVILVDEYIGKTIQSLIISIANAMMTISFIIIIICFISIFNYVTLTFYEQRKNYGIYKVLGFSQKQIRWILVFRVQVITLVAIVLGFILMLLLAPKILNLLFKSFGGSKSSFGMDFGMTLFIIPFSMALTGISTWISSGRVKSLSPRELIVE